MRKRKEKTKPSKTLATQKDGDDDDENEVSVGRFFACYLLTSLSPRHKGHTYIGFTVNPMRRIRQHNGEIGCGAFRTKRKRPWEMVMCIYGFPTNVSALQFEWAWQHPKESLAVRKAAAELKSLTGVANKIKLAYIMLTLQSWQRLNLTVNFFSTKYTTHCASCPNLPDHMKVTIQSMNDLPCYNASLNCSYEDEHDFSDGDQLSHSGSPADIVPKETGAECDKAVLSDSGHEKQLFSDMSDAYERALQLPTEVKKDCSSQELPNDEKYWSIINETSTWCSYATDLVTSTEPEVIDLMTPSPDCRTRILSKKKHDRSIIDLTRSPNFIQL